MSDNIYLTILVTSAGKSAVVPLRCSEVKVESAMNGKSTSNMNFQPVILNKITIKIRHRIPE